MRKISSTVILQFLANIEVYHAVSAANGVEYHRLVLIFIRSYRNIECRLCNNHHLRVHECKKDHQ